MSFHIETQHFINRYVRSHLNEHKNIFDISSGFQTTPWGFQNGEKLKFSHFYHILTVFETLTHLNITNEP